MALCGGVGTRRGVFEAVIKVPFFAVLSFEFGFLFLLRL